MIVGPASSRHPTRVDRLQFFSVDGEMKVNEQQRQEAIALCHQSDQRAALACMEAFGTTDFRGDLPNVTVPTLVIHGDGDGVLPSTFPGSAPRPRSRSRNWWCCRTRRTVAS